MHTGLLGSARSRAGVALRPVLSFLLGAEAEMWGEPHMLLLLMVVVVGQEAEEERRLRLYWPQSQVFASLEDAAASAASRASGLLGCKPWGVAKVCDAENVSDSHTLQSQKANRRREAREANAGARPTVPWNTSASPKQDKCVPPSQRLTPQRDQVYEALEQYQAPLREITGLEQKLVDNVTLAEPCSCQLRPGQARSEEQDL
eukprot:Skav209533  [mRNA]  locus=scaffold2497:26921:31536:- [translate_table: standard]